MNSHMYLLLILAVLLGAGQATGVQPKTKAKTILFGKTKTHWATSPACPGYHPSYAEVVANALAERIEKGCVFKVIGPTRARKLMKKCGFEASDLSNFNRLEGFSRRADFDLVMHVEVMCHPGNAELNMLLVEPRSAQIVWAKNMTMQDVREAEHAVDRIAHHIAHYGRTGKMGPEIKYRNLAVPPVRLAPGLPGALDRNGLTRTLRRKLADSDTASTTWTREKSLCLQGIVRMRINTAPQIPNQES